MRYCEGLTTQHGFIPVPTDRESGYSTPQGL
jgi:hypothetical protein